MGYAEDEREARWTRAATEILAGVGIEGSGGDGWSTPPKYQPPYEDTPARFARALEEMLHGHWEPAPVLRTFEYTGPEQLVTSYDNQAYCLCPHHLLTVELTCSVGYLVGPGNRKIIGLSKVPRLVKWAASRLATQEEIASLIAERLSEVLGTRSVFVHLRGAHSCMRARGIKTRGKVDTLLALDPTCRYWQAFREGLPG